MPVTSHIKLILSWIVLTMERWAGILRCESHLWKDPQGSHEGLFAPDEIRWINHEQIV